MENNLNAFEIENRCRKVMHDMLKPVSEKSKAVQTLVAETIRRVDSLNGKVNDFGIRLDREQNLKKQIEDMKKTFFDCDREKNKELRLLADSVDFNKNKIKHILDKIEMIDVDKSVFTETLDQIKNEIKDFEGLLEDFKTVRDNQFLELKSNMEQEMQEVHNWLANLEADRKQVKAMIRNQNFHFTELQKHNGINQNKIEQINEQIEPLEELIKQINATDDFIQYYQPLETIEMIHKALAVSLKTSNTKMRLDSMSYMQSQVNKFKGFINRKDDAEDPQRPEFLKNVPVKIDLNQQIVELEQKFEEEEEARRKEERELKKRNLKRKNSDAIFEDRLYSERNIHKLQKIFEKRLKGMVVKSVNKTIDNSKPIQKLIDFYEEEFGQSESSEEEEDSCDNSEEESNEDTSPQKSKNKKRKRSTNDMHDASLNSSALANISIKTEEEFEEIEVEIEVEETETESDEDDDEVNRIQEPFEQQMNQQDQSSGGLQSSMVQGSQLVNQQINNNQQMTPSPDMAANLNSSNQSTLYQNFNSSQSQPEGMTNINSTDNNGGTICFDKNQYQPSTKKLKRKRIVKKIVKQIVPKQSSKKKKHSSSYPSKHHSSISIVNDTDSDDNNENVRIVKKRSKKKSQMNLKKSSTQILNKDEDKVNANGQQDNDGDQLVSNQQQEQHAMTPAQEQSQNQKFVFNQKDINNANEQSQKADQNINNYDVKADNLLVADQQVKKTINFNDKVEERNRDSQILIDDEDGSEHDEDGEKAKHRRSTHSIKPKSSSKRKRQTKEVVNKQPSRHTIARQQQKDELDKMMTRIEELLSLQQKQNNEITELRELQRRKEELDELSKLYQFNSEDEAESSEFDEQYESEVDSQERYNEGNLSSIAEEEPAIQKEPDDPNMELNQRLEKMRLDRQKELMDALNKTKKIMTKEPQQPDQSPSQSQRVATNQSTVSNNGMPNFMERKQQLQQQSSSNYLEVQQQSPTSAANRKMPPQRSFKQRPVTIKFAEPTAAPDGGRNSQQSNLVSPSSAAAMGMHSQQPSFKQKTYKKQFSNVKTPQAKRKTVSVITWDHLQKQVPGDPNAIRQKVNSSQIQKIGSGGNNSVSEMKVRKTSAKRRPGNLQIKIEAMMIDKLQHYARLDEFKVSREETTVALGQVKVLTEQLKMYQISEKQIKQQEEFHQIESKISKQLIALENEVHLSQAEKVNAFGKVIQQLQENMVGLRKRIDQAEEQRLKDEYRKLPKDIMVLAKGEAQLRKELTIALAQGDELKDELAKELKRLKREHLVNNKDMDEVMKKFLENDIKVKNISERQLLSENALATLLKIQKISNCMEIQDDIDRKNIYLMGGKTINNQNQQVPPTSLQQQLLLPPNRSPLDLNTSFDNADLDESRTLAENKSYTTASGSYSHRGPKPNPLIQPNASTTLPLNQLNPQNIVSLDKNCLSCSNSAQPMVLKAFKIACLQYEPSQVVFEKCSFSRSHLIHAKSDLLNICLEQQKHLNLNNLEQQYIKERLSNIENDSLLNQQDQPYPRTYANELLDNILMQQSKDIPMVMSKASIKEKLTPFRQSHDSLPVNRFIDSARKVYSIQTQPPEMVNQQVIQAAVSSADPQIQQRKVGRSFDLRNATLQKNASQSRQQEDNQLRKQSSGAVEIDKLKLSIDGTNVKKYTEHHRHNLLTQESPSIQKLVNQQKPLKQVKITKKNLNLNTSIGHSTDGSTNLQNQQVFSNANLNHGGHGGSSTPVVSLHTSIFQRRTNGNNYQNHHLPSLTQSVSKKHNHESLADSIDSQNYLLNTTRNRNPSANINGGLQSMSHQNSISLQLNNL